MHEKTNIERPFCNNYKKRLSCSFKVSAHPKDYLLNSMLNSVANFHVLKWWLNINQLYHKCTSGTINGPATKPAYPGKTLLSSLSHHVIDFNY